MTTLGTVVAAVARDGVVRAVFDLPSGERRHGIIDGGGRDPLALMRFAVSLIGRRIDTRTAKVNGSDITYQVSR